MCTLILLFRPKEDWPVIIAGNRDEMRNRSWLAPDYHWPHNPHIFAGKDLTSGGSWLGVNTHTALFAAINNRMGSLGPQVGKHSRGELVLNALQLGSLDLALDYIGSLDIDLYRGFNMVLAAADNACWIRHDESNGPLSITPIMPGLHMLTAGELDDNTDKRIQNYLPRFNSAMPPNVTGEQWQDWQHLLAEKSTPGDMGLNIETDWGFATVCSHLLAVSRNGEIHFQFAPGPPHIHGYERLLPN